MILQYSITNHYIHKDSDEERLYSRILRRFTLWCTHKYAEPNYILYISNYISSLFVLVNLPLFIVICTGFYKKRNNHIVEYSIWDSFNKSFFRYFLGFLIILASWRIEQTNTQTAYISCPADLKLVIIITCNIRYNLFHWLNFASDEVVEGRHRLKLFGWRLNSAHNPLVTLFIAIKHECD